MKTIFSIFLFTLAFLTSAGYAETEFSIDGSIRLRAEYDLKSFDIDRHSQTFQDLRTRIGLTFKPVETVRVYVQLQDSRRLGSAASGTPASLSNIDMHQGYIEISGIGPGTSKLKAGRFAFKFGNQRVFSTNNWSNVGRAWDGAMFSMDLTSATSHLFYLRRLEVNDQDYNRDFDIYGVYTEMSRWSLDVFFFAESDADSTNYVRERLHRFNLGGFTSQHFGAFDLLVQGSFQFGTQARDTLPDTVVQDIEAFMLNAEAGVTLDDARQTRVAIGTDYTTGANPADSSTFSVYQNSYATGHAFRGYMDYFTGSPAYGVLDIYLRFGSIIFPQHKLALDVHYFRSDVDYLSRADDSTLTTDLGIEFDLMHKWTIAAGTTLQTGVSMFFADSHFAAAGDERNPGLWIYSMLGVSF